MKKSSDGNGLLPDVRIQSSTYNVHHTNEKNVKKNDESMSLYTDESLGRFKLRQSSFEFS